MGLVLVQKMLPVLAKMKWPSNPRPTLLGHKTYEVGIDKVDNYRDDPQILGAALRTFQTSDSRPYALAGAAFALIAASREEDGTFAQEGLDASLSLLEKAQETAPDIPDINMVEALIYVYGKRLNDARTVLDYLHLQDPHNFYIHRAELAYWVMQGDYEKALFWCGNTMNMAKELPQRLRLKSTLGEVYLGMGQPQKALAALQEAAHFDPHNPYIVNQMANAYLEMKDLKEASQYNDRALKMLRFPAALETQAQIRHALGTTGNLRERIFGHS